MNKRIIHALVLTTFGLFATSSPAQSTDQDILEDKRVAEARALMQAGRDEIIEFEMGLTEDEARDVIAFIRELDAGEFADEKLVESREVAGDRKLDFFVLFSSLAGTLGNIGQGAYAAANAFTRALQIDPDHAGAMGFLGVALMANDFRWAEGMDLFYGKAGCGDCLCRAAGRRTGACIRGVCRPK